MLVTGVTVLACLSGIMWWPDASTIFIPDVSGSVPVALIALFCSLAWLSRKRFMSDAVFFKKHYCSGLLFLLMVITFFGAAWSEVSFLFHHTVLAILAFSLLMIFSGLLSFVFPYGVMRLYVPSGVENIYFAMISNSLTVHVSGDFFPEKDTADNPLTAEEQDEAEMLFIGTFIARLLPALPPGVKDVTMASHVINHKRRGKLVDALTASGAKITLEEQRETPLIEIFGLNLQYGGLRPLKGLFSLMKRNGFKVRKYGSRIVFKPDAMRSSVLLTK
ncbi:hypothetical protein QCD58_004596 [Enterobacter hormaechei]|nr:hypothetical protein [Enterobacter hormaechei]